MKTTTKQTHLYSNTDLRKLLIPIIIEQLLSSLMGTVDTMMVSNVGSAAISAVSLVDSINILVIQALSALAAGGAILCSQYLCIFHQTRNIFLWVFYIRLYCLVEYFCIHFIFLP